MQIIKVLLGSFLCGVLTFSAHGRTWDVADVKAKSKNIPSDRCETIQGQACIDTNKFSLDMRAITPAAYNWLTENGYYVTPAGPGKAGAICKCGCFAPDMAVLVYADGQALWRAARDISLGDSLFALGSEAALAAPVFQPTEVINVTSGPEKPELYVFHLPEGVKLEVTQFHGMVLSDGSVVAAKDVTNADHFLDLNGNKVEILGISRRPITDDVVNFEVEGTENINHIIAAQGVLVGDLAWQNKLATELGQVQIRQ